jgi:DNA-binding MarR family transcriptional regulator
MSPSSPPRSRAEMMIELDLFMREIGALANAMFSGYMAELNLTLPMAHALRELTQPMPMGALAEKLSCDASYITGLADQLEERGLVSREPDPDDRRVRRLVITPLGEVTAAKLHAQMVENHPIFTYLTDDEMATVLDIMSAGMRRDKAAEA